MSEPIVGADLFRKVLAAAGGRCQCTGQCGQLHKKGEGRCSHEHDHYASKQGRWVRLLAAPADPLTGNVAAAGLPADRLRAWCPGCFTAARRIAQQQTPTYPDQCDLFEL